MNLARDENDLENSMYKLIHARDDLRALIAKLCDQEEKVTKQINNIESFLNNEEIQNENLFS